MIFTYFKKDWFIGLLVVLFFVGMATSGRLGEPDNFAYDLGVRLSPARTPNKNIVIIAIDDAALQEMGSWPWSRDIMAKLTRKIVAARPKVIGYALPFDSRQGGRDLESFKQLKKRLRSSSKTTQKLIRQLEADLDTDQAFASSLKRSGRVVMAAPYHPIESVALRGQTSQSHNLRRYGLRKVEGLNQEPVGWINVEPVPVAGLIFPPIEEFHKYVGALGHIRLSVPKGESARSEPLVIRSGDIYLPSFSLIMAARSKGLGSQDIRLDLTNKIELPGIALPTDKSFHIYPSFYAEKDGQAPFEVYSILDVLNNQVKSSVFRNKSVMIGLTARQQVSLFETPLGISMAPVMVAAHHTSAILNGDLYLIPDWTDIVKILFILAIGLYLVLILPRFKVGMGLVLSALVLIILLNIHFISMISNFTWIPLALPMMTLLVGHMVLGVKHLFEAKMGVVKAELSDASRTIGQSFQSQGLLDQAFEQYRRCAINSSLLDTLYNLGLDYERKRQFNKAVTVFRYIRKYNRRHQDIDERINRNQEMVDVLVLGNGGAGSASGTLILNKSGIQKPMLGRYQIDREIGKGAMGVVYLGHDPKIDRTVAIKTMLLSEEFEGDKLEEAKKRFFREAETAGRLNHPNIVTIYDVGEDQDLCYIAMSYLTGSNLLEYCTGDNLLPLKTVLQLTMKTANALDYAHKQNVIHRDIKPANIIYDAEQGSLKVTDFGIAYLAGTGLTRTGTILGSPSYMSPEQLAGEKLDGRSDIFSLGVTLFQLLTGELPFIGDSLANLMYKIANEKHPDVRLFKKDLPLNVNKLINKALQKDIDKRYQSGAKFEVAIQKFIEQL
ncbi:MAG: CHASE2 domain-containing protein [Proteobacteria bacterium]|nr:CHASE2 domain-containing protein [Pseudomonadota bacterium]